MYKSNDLSAIDKIEPLLIKQKIHVKNSRGFFVL